MTITPSSPRATKHLIVDTARIAYFTQGEGAPVLLMHPGALADGLLPLMNEAVLASRHRLIYYHRRGYRSSTTGSAPASIPSHAADAAALLKHLGVERAHIVGHSAGGVVALQLARDAPELVHSLSLLEPALAQVRSGPSFLRQHVLPAIDHYRSGDAHAAVEAFLEGAFGGGWRQAIERRLPRAIDHAVEDADAFFGFESPAIQQWTLGPEALAAIHQPLLYMVGACSERFRREGRELLHRWIDEIEDCDLPGCTHLLQLQDPGGAAAALASFLARNPVGPPASGTPEALARRVPRGRGRPVQMTAD